MPIDAPVREMSMEVDAAASETEVGLGLQVHRIKDVYHLVFLNAANSDLAILGRLGAILWRGNALAQIMMLFLKVENHQPLKRASSYLKQLSNGVRA